MTNSILKYNKISHKTEQLDERASSSSASGARRHDGDRSHPSRFLCSPDAPSRCPITSLVGKEQITTIYSERTEYQKRVSKKKFRLKYRIKSGLMAHRGERLRHLVLTSPNGTDLSVLSNHKQRLIQEIRRKTPLWFVSKGYITLQKCHYYYPNKPLNEPLNIQFLNIKTNEGNGVYHMMCVGDFIPQRWVADCWDHIHHARNVSITDHGMIYGTEGRLTGYLLNQYIIGHTKLLDTRLSWSRGWVFRRFVRVWEHICKVERNPEIRDRWWEEVCQARSPPPPFDSIQVELMNK